MSTAMPLLRASSCSSLIRTMSSRAARFSRCASALPDARVDARYPVQDTALGHAGCVKLGESYAFYQVLLP
mgnify:CR=1 FL=1